LHKGETVPDLSRRRFCALAAATATALLPGCSTATDPEPEPEAAEKSTGSLSFSPAELDDYTFENLSELSKAISEAADDTAGRALATEYKLLDDSGAIADQVMRREMTDGTVLEIRVAGILHDDYEDQSGKAGLTLLCAQAPDLGRMNDTVTEAGGWREAQLRTWLQEELPKLLPQELPDLVKGVVKQTNNLGEKATVSDVTASYETFWIPSVVEVCGSVDWFAKEYGADLSSYDDVLNAEGTQYEWFRQQGVTASDDPNHALALTYLGKSVAWWYRSPFPYVYSGLASGYFYNVMQTGFPKAYSEANQELGVVFGFCL
jgi:hypothetical protein